jgi:prolipoprotein diacylglyceryl transferase
MRQILFYIPLHDYISDSLPNVPVYGYGMMLFLAFVLCSWLAGRLSRREGIDPKFVQDLAIWLFVTGILGARITFILQEWPNFANKPGSNWPNFAARPWNLLALWDGGLVLYGSIIGGAIGYFFAHRRFLAPAGVSAWKMADVLAPCIALGVGLGRVGCLFTGCCYGNVACAGCTFLPLTFPLPSAPVVEMAQRGYQTLAGFIVQPATLQVDSVEPGSAAATAGLKPGDFIINVNGLDVSTDKHEKTKDGQEVVVSRVEQFHAGLLHAWPRGVSELNLKVLRGGRELDLQFMPRSLPLQPTQVYETISMGLLLFFLVSYYPCKQRDGAVMVFLMIGYSLHRYLNEMLRSDNPKIVLDVLTFSQTVSLLILLAGLVLAYIVFVRRAATPAPAPAPEPQVTSW